MASRASAPASPARALAADQPSAAVRATPLPSSQARVSSSTSSESLGSSLSRVRITAPTMAAQLPIAARRLWATLPPDARRGRDVAPVDDPGTNLVGPQWNGLNTPKPQS